jgi:hypothetical protein
MKTILITILSFAAVFSAYSQTAVTSSSKSASKQISFKKNVPPGIVKLLPDLQITNQTYADQNGNNIIDAEENASVRFTIENQGKGEAQEVSIKITLLNSPILGLDFQKTLSLGVLYPSEKKEITIPVIGGTNLVNSSARFRIEALEKNGFDAYPSEMEIQTRELGKPEVIVADWVFSTEGGGRIKLNSPINLKVLVQNTGTGDARNVNAEFILENTDCVMLDENKFNIGILRVGESKELNFIFTATRKYAFDKIPVIISLSENSGKYAEKKSVSVGLEENLTLNNAVVIKGDETSSAAVTRASLSSDVEKDIPVNPVKYPGRLCLIIGNENYSSKQTNLKTESNVRFAANDAQIFREYARKTLGAKDENIFLLIDATAGEMMQNLDLISKLASRIGPESEIFFYYAGHGLPDETTRTPYLIPVDVSGTNLNAAVKLSDVYKKFGVSGSGRVCVFLDACFSGGGRDAGLLAARGVKIIPREETLTGNLVVFSASGGEQSALPYGEKQHGMFTYFLLKKIKESSGDITYKELRNYVTKNVSIESLRINAKEQDPVVSISPSVENKWETWKINP